MYICLNSGYFIWNASGCSYLCRRAHNSEGEWEFCMCLPPAVGFILAEIGKHDRNNSITLISERLGVSRDSIENFVRQLTENQHPLKWEYRNGISIIFPAKLLTTEPHKLSLHDFSHNEFHPLSEFAEKRPPYPLNANIMITGKCTVKCVYCYAERQRKDMSNKQIRSILKDLKTNGCLRVSLTGGDVFARTDWKDIIRSTCNMGYRPFVSTKTPLTETDLEHLAEMGLREFQFSLDSVHPSTLSNIIGANKEYIDAVKSMLATCDKLGFKLVVRSVISAYNQNIEQLESLYAFLNPHTCVRQWEITPCFHTGHQEGEKVFAPDRDSLKKISQWFENKSIGIPYRLNKMDSQGYFLNRCKTCRDFTSTNPICLGNVTTISILSDGTATVCEMLYDNEEYKLGNVCHSSVGEVWNGERALLLCNPIQAKFTQSSPCSTCSEFRNCRTSIGSKICFSDLSKLGLGYDFPDPRCPMSSHTDLIL